jgi:uncharacterized protein YxeA
MQKIIHDNKKISFLLLILLLSVIGSTLIYYSTNWDPWAFSDSAAYISSAKNFNLGLGISLISAKGIVTPLEVFPPLYPFSISTIAHFGLDYLTAARVLDVLLFGLLIFVFAWGIMTLTGKFWLALISSLLVLFSPVMLNNYGGVMTEPLFITLFYASFFFTLIYIQQQKTHLFLLAVLFTGFSPLVRYIGIFTIIVNFLFILLFDKSVWRKRIIKGGIFGFLSSLPILTWFVLTYTNINTIGAHTITQSSDLMTNLISFYKGTVAVFQSWLPYIQYRVDLFPDQLKSIFFIISAIILFALGTFFYSKSDNQKQFNPVLQIMLAAFLTNIIYIIVFCAIVLFAVPTPPIISRMFSPILPSLVLMFNCGVVFLIEQAPKRWKTYVTVFMTLLIVVLTRYYFLRSIAISKELHENGYGFTAREIQTSGFIKAVQNLPVETPLIANTPAMVLFYTDRMPYSVDYIPTNTFGIGKSTTEQLFSTQHAALILEFAVIRNVYPDWEERLTSFTRGLTISFKDEIGGIYFSPPGTSP